MIQARPLAALAGALVLGFSAAALAGPPPSSSPPKSNDTYTRGEVESEAEQFFGKGAKGLAEVIRKAFDEYGEPNAIIKGEEAGGAIAFGLRYGKGQLVTKGGASREVWWQGPSLGFDIGGNAAKCFTLVYNLRGADSLFQRFPGVEGSLYFVGGFSLNYNRLDNITLAPVRFGVGWRQGASVGYLHFSPKRRVIPF